MEFTQKLRYELPSLINTHTHTHIWHKRWETVGKWVVFPHGCHWLASICQRLVNQCSRYSVKEQNFDLENTSAHLAEVKITPSLIFLAQRAIDSLHQLFCDTALIPEGERLCFGFLSTPGFKDLLEDTLCGNVLISNEEIRVFLHRDLLGTQCTTVATVHHFYTSSWLYMSSEMKMDRYTEQMIKHSIKCARNRVKWCLEQTSNYRSSGDFKPALSKWTRTFVLQPRLHVLIIEAKRPCKWSIILY